MTIQEFIQSQESELRKPIDNINWKEMYKKATTSLGTDKIGKFTEFLLGLDIHPEYYLSELPSWFLSTANITDFVIPDNITDIGLSAFSFCDDLTSVVIPDSITFIGSYAFYSCGSLTSIKYRGTEEQWYAIPKGSDWDHYYANGYKPLNYTITYEYKGI